MQLNDEIRQAALDLNERLRGTPSLVSVGIGEENGRPIFLLYFSSVPKKAVREKLPQEWRHFPVRATNLGKIIPAN